MSNKNSWSSNSWGSNSWADNENSNSDKNSWAGNETLKSEKWTGIRSRGGWGDNSEVWRANDGRSDGGSGSRSHGDWLDKGWEASWKDTGIGRTPVLQPLDVDFNKLVYEASWMVQGSVYDFNKHADLWRGRDADGYLPNPKDETDSMFVHADDEQDDLRSRGSKQQAADDEQDDLRSRGSKQASIGSADGITAISMHLPASFQFRPDPGIEVPEHAIMTLQYFQALKAYCSWKLHNHALKMFRDYYERDFGPNLGGGDRIPIESGF